jgi:hypothetical protein
VRGPAAIASTLPDRPPLPRDDAPIPVDRAEAVTRGSATTVIELKAIVRVECDRGDVLVDLEGDGPELHVVLIALGRSIAKGILY